MKHHLCPPELKLTAILFGLALFLCGCSSTYSVRSTAGQNTYTYGKMNEELKRQRVTIELKDGRHIIAKDVTISDDSVSWLDARTEEQSKASIRQINKIVNKNHGLGGLEGMGFGLVVGGGVGALAGNSSDNGSWGTGAGAAIGLILGGGVGIFIGLPTGLIIGHSHNYEFSTTEQGDSLGNGKSR